MMAIPDWLRDAVAHAGIPLVRATIVFVGHAAATVVILTSMKLVEMVVHFYWGWQDQLVYGRYPLNYLFQTIDVGLIVVLGYNGIREAIDAYRRPL